MAWIETRGAQHRVYWRTIPGRGAPKTFEPFADRASAEQFVELGRVVGGYEAARRLVRSGALAAIAAAGTEAGADGSGPVAGSVLEAVPAQGAPTGSAGSPTPAVWILDRLMDAHLAQLTCRPRTISDYRRDYFNHIRPYFGGDRDIRTIRSGRGLDLTGPALDLEADTGETVRGWIQWLKRRNRLTPQGTPGDTPLSAKTIRGLHALLSAALELAVQAEPRPLIDRNPCGASALPESDPGRAQILQPGAARRLLDAFDGVWRILVAFLLATGVRFGEAAGLDVGDVHLDAAVPYIDIRKAWARGPNNRYLLGRPKTTSSIRRVSLPAFLVEMLRPLMADRPADAPLFTMPRGGRLHHGNVLNRVWRPAVLAAATDGTVPDTLRIHDLRHTHASWLVQSRPILSVMARLGHSSILTTQRYLHLLDGQSAEDAAAVQTLLAPELAPMTETERAGAIDPALPVLDIDDTDDLAA